MQSMEQIGNQSSAKEKANAAGDFFYLELLNGNPVAAVRGTVPALPDGVRKVGDAFLHNISAVASTMGIPATLADAAAGLQLWTRVMLAERLRAKAADLRGNALSEEQILNRVKEQMDRHSGEADHLFGEGMCDFLLAVHQAGTVSSAVSELHGQGVVLMWSAFEVLARDLFVYSLNCKPDLASRILGDETTKRLFQLKGLDFETLAQYSFDVSHAMGEILIQAHDLGSLTAMKACFTALFPDVPTLRACLSDHELWLLAQRRHLIVHRRGIVDNRYLESTGEKLMPGSQISVSPSDIERGLDIVCSAGIELLKSVAAVVPN